MDVALGFAGLVLQVVLLWRLLSWRAWRFYPFFLGFFTWALARVVLLVIQEVAHPLSLSLYSNLFWYSAVFTVALRFLVFWEVFRNALPRPSAIQRLAAILLAAALASLAILFNLAAAPPNVFPTLIANLSFAVAVCIVGLLALVTYYRLSPGLNVWGMALGIGLLSALDVLNYSANQLDPNLFPVTRYVRPASFFIQMFVWLPALWSYAPPAPLPGGPPPTAPPPGEPAGQAIRRALGL